MTRRHILTNALVVTAERTLPGSVVIEDDRIADVSLQPYYADGLDLGGRYLIPGIIDIHTDYLEKELHPRPGAAVPLEMAFHFMDVRAIACGLTTVLGAARISDDSDTRGGAWGADGLALASRYADLAQHAMARHLVHVRYNPNFEPVDDVLATLAALPALGNVVYNEAIPGERQFRHAIEERVAALAQKEGLSIAAARRRWEGIREALSRVNTRAQVHRVLGGALPIGSHDDTTVEHVDEAFANGATLSEMPCTIEAARRAKALGMQVCMGAPNYFRGGSHCGNLSCADAMAEGLVDILCSDFHFPSMLGSAVKMMAVGIAPSRAINMLTLHPARHLGRDSEFGSIAVGKKADLVAFSAHASFADVHGVWVDGMARLLTGGGRPSTVAALPQPVSA